MIELFSGEHSIKDERKQIIIVIKHYKAAMKYRCTALFLSVVLLEILLPSTAACSCAKVTAQKAFCRADWGQLYFPFIKSFIFCIWNLITSSNHMLDNIMNISCYLRNLLITGSYFLFSLLSQHTFNLCFSLKCVFSQRFNCFSMSCTHWSWQLFKWCKEET